MNAHQKSKVAQLRRWSEECKSDPLTSVYLSQVADTYAADHSRRLVGGYKNIREEVDRIAAVDGCDFFNQTYDPYHVIRNLTGTYMWDLQDKERMKS